MIEYIGKARALYKIKDVQLAGFDVEAAYKAVEAIPAADVQEKRVGYWMKRTEKKEIAGGIVFNPVWRCSECEKDYDPAVCSIIKYCYNCGAKMETEVTREKKMEDE